MLSWIAGLTELLSMWLLGSKNRLGFIVSLICEVMWVGVVIQTPEVNGILVVVIPGMFLNVRGFIKWRKNV